MATCSRLVLAMAVITGTLIFNDSQVSAQCDGAVPQLISQCGEFMVVGEPKVQPSSQCCSLLKHINIPCVCSLVIPDIERMISMEKAVYVGRSCGIPARPGTKCGSYVIPPTPLI